jgi:hypothetical protein
LGETAIQSQIDKSPVFGITMGMTTTKLVSVKVPLKIFRALPGAHKGRSRFIVAALEEKISRCEPDWQPTTARGRRLKAILDKGAAERGEPLDAEGIAAELAERRGRFH